MTAMRYSLLPDHLRKALSVIEPSKDGELIYFPCQAFLRNGDVVDTVYIVAEKPYIRKWGVYPEDDRGKSWVRIEDIAEIRDSPARLPACFANEIYTGGESGMGYAIFTVVFGDGERQACVTGGAVDFIRYPNGKGPIDVVAVIPHEGRDDSPVKSPRWDWCLYSEQA